MPPGSGVLAIKMRQACPADAGRPSGPMVAQRSGALVVTASISSLRGAHSMGAYCASKFAVYGAWSSRSRKETGPPRRARQSALTPDRSRRGCPGR